MPRPTPPSVTTILFCLRLAVFSAAAVAIAFTIDEIAGIAAENASTGGDGSSLGQPWQSSESASADGEPETQGDVHRQALHWDGGGESASSLVAVGTLFCIFCVGGLLSAVAFFIAARHCQDCYFGGLYLVRSEAIVAGVLTIALCLFGVPLVVMFPAVPNGSYLATLLILIRVSQVLALAAILVQVGHLAQLRVDRVIAKATRGSMVRLGQPSPKQEFRMEEATKEFVSVAVGGGPDEAPGLDPEQVEVVLHDKPRFLREKPKLVHRITKEDLWGAKERLRKISIDTLDSVFAGFEMPQVARLDIPGDTFAISSRENENGTSQGDGDTEALLADGESQGHNNDDEGFRVEKLEAIQDQCVGADEEKEVNEDREQQELGNSNSNDEDETALPIDVAGQKVDEEVSEQEADDENESVSEDNEQELDRASNGKMNPDPSFVIMANLDDSFSD